MGGKAVCKLLGLLLCAALLTGCAAAATTANVAQEEEAVAAASVHGENIPLAKAAAEEDTAETASPTADAHVVEITLPPVTATPAFLLEASATAGQQQPDQTPEVTPASTPAPTATPKNTPAAYTVEELRTWLMEAGFTHIRTYGDCRMSAPREGERRIYFTAIRGQEELSLPAAGNKKEGNH